MIQAEIKYARSLNNQKYRKEHNAYLIEGNKIVKEWLTLQEPIQSLMANEEWLNENRTLLQYIPERNIKTATTIELSKISNLQSPVPVMAIVEQRPKTPHTFNTKGWTLILDRIQDPGNMGTIIRIADWYGIQEIICTTGTVEAYNPKVVQATMGSLLRVKISEINIEELIVHAQKPILAAALNGSSIYEKDVKAIEAGYIILGNESQGIHPSLLSQIPHHITIPRIGEAESLNVGVACGIICSHLCIS